MEAKRVKATFSTDKEIKSLKPKDKQYILTDSYTKGLQLIIRVDGGNNRLLDIRALCSKIKMANQSSDKQA